MEFERAKIKERKFRKNLFVLYLSNGDKKLGVIIPKFVNEYLDDVEIHIFEDVEYNDFLDFDYYYNVY